MLVRDWLGPPPAAVDRDAALARLARRYLVGHGPATDRDLARWCALPLRDVRRGLTEIAAELTDRGPDLAGHVGLADLANRDGPGLPPPRLLGAFDPLLLGWASRETYLGAHHGIVTVNGLFRPFALVRGRAAATWSMRHAEVTLKPFTSLTGAEKAALDRDAANVKRFLGTA